MKLKATGFVEEIKQKLSQKQRKKCNCPHKEVDGTCTNAYKWLFMNYKKSDLPWLKSTYEKLYKDAAKKNFD